MAAAAAAAAEELQKKARRAIPPEELGNHTVESLLTLHRDKLVQEMDTVSAKLVQGVHDACARAAESLRNEFAQEAPSVEKRTITLTTTAGPHIGANFELSFGHEACFIGRSTGRRFRVNGVSLPRDDEVSTTHAKIECKNGQVVIIDLGSTNGTVVNGAYLDEGRTQPLENGANVVVGSSKFVVKL